MPGKRVNLRDKPYLVCLLQGVEIERLTDALGKYQAKLWSLDKSQGNIGSFEQQIKELTEEIDRQSKQFDKYKEINTMLNIDCNKLREYLLKYREKYTRYNQMLPSLNKLMKDNYMLQYYVNACQYAMRRELSSKQRYLDYVRTQLYGLLKEKYFQSQRYIENLSLSNSRFEVYLLTLKDSLVVLRKEKDYLSNENNHLNWKVNYLAHCEAISKEYENNMTLMSMEINRLRILQYYNRKEYDYMKTTKNVQYYVNRKQLQDMERMTKDLTRLQVECQDLRGMVEKERISQIQGRTQLEYRNRQLQKWQYQIQYKENVIADYDRQLKQVQYHLLYRQNNCKELYQIVDKERDSRRKEMMENYQMRQGLKEMEDRINTLKMEQMEIVKSRNHYYGIIKKLESYRNIYGSYLRKEIDRIIINHYNYRNNWQRDTREICYKLEGIIKDKNGYLSTSQREYMSLMTTHTQIIEQMKKYKYQLEVVCKDRGNYIMLLKSEQYKRIATVSKTTEGIKREKYHLEGLLQEKANELQVVRYEHTRKANSLLTNMYYQRRYYDTVYKERGALQKEKEILMYRLNQLGLANQQKDRLVVYRDGLMMERYKLLREREGQIKDWYMWMREREYLLRERGGIIETIRMMHGNIDLLMKEKEETQRYKERYKRYKQDMERYKDDLYRYITILYGYLSSNQMTMSTVSVQNYYFVYTKKNEIKALTIKYESMMNTFKAELYHLRGYNQQLKTTVSMNERQLFDLNSRCSEVVTKLTIMGNELERVTRIAHYKYEKIVQQIEYLRLMELEKNTAVSYVKMLQRQIEQYKLYGTLTSEETKDGFRSMLLYIERLNALVKEKDGVANGLREYMLRIVGKIDMLSLYQNKIIQALQQIMNDDGKHDQSMDKQFISLRYFVNALHEKTIMAISYVHKNTEIVSEHMMDNNSIARKDYSYLQGQFSYLQGQFSYLQGQLHNLNKMLQMKYQELSVVRYMNSSKVKYLYEISHTLYEQKKVEIEKNEMVGRLLYVTHQNGQLREYLVKMEGYYQNELRNRYRTYEYLHEYYNKLLKVNETLKLTNYTSKNDNKSKITSIKSIQHYEDAIQKIQVELQELSKENIDLQTVCEYNKIKIESMQRMVGDLQQEKKELVERLQYFYRQISVKQYEIVQFSSRIHRDNYYFLERHRRYGRQLKDYNTKLKYYCRRLTEQTHKTQQQSDDRMKIELQTEQIRKYEYIISTLREQHSVNEYSYKQIVNKLYETKYVTNQYLGNEKVLKEYLTGVRRDLAVVQNRVNSLYYEVNSTKSELNSTKNELSSREQYSRRKEEYNRQLQDKLVLAYANMKELYLEMMRSTNQAQRSALSCESEMAKLKYDKQTVYLGLSKLFQTLSICQQQLSALKSYLESIQHNYNELSYQIVTLSQKTNYLSKHYYYQHGIRYQIYALYDQLAERHNTIRRLYIDNKFLVDYDMGKQHALTVLDSKYALLYQYYDRLQYQMGQLHSYLVHYKTRNHQLEIELRKLEYVKSKMDILSQEITRLDCDRIDLTEEVSECRFAIGEEGVMARRLQYQLTLIVMLIVEVYALRQRLQAQQNEIKSSRENELSRVRP